MVRQRLFEICGIVCACCLLAFYLLPNTIFARLSPLDWFVWTRTGVSSRQPVAILALGCLAVWALVRVWRARRTGLILGGVIGIYSALLVLSAVIPGNSLAASNDAFSILLAFSTGLASAWLASIGRFKLLPVFLLIGVQCVYALVLRSRGLNGVQSGQQLVAGGTFLQSSYLSVVAGMGLAMALAVGSIARSSKLMVGSYTAMVLCFACLALTWNCDVFIATAIAAIFVVWKTSKDIKATVLLGSAFLVVAILPFTMRPSKTLADAAAAPPELSRVALAQGAIDAIKQHPVTGIGIGTLATGDKTAEAGDASSTTNAGLRDPQSVPLRWMMEMGLVGGVLFLVLVWGVARYAWAAESDLSIMTATGMITLIASSIFGETFATAGHSVGTVLLGYLVALAMFESQVAPTPMEAQPAGQLKVVNA